MTRQSAGICSRWETTIIAVFDSTLGLAVVTMIAAAAGATAAILPSRRAARLDVLAALVSQ